MAQATASETIVETAAAPASMCPRCGAPADTGQLACVECGAPLAVGWRRPPSWRVPAGIAAGVLLATGLGLGAGIGALAGGDDGDAPATVASSPAPAPPAQQPPAAPSTDGQPSGGSSGAERRDDREPSGSKRRSSAARSGAGTAPPAGAGTGSGGGSNETQRDREPRSDSERKPRENTASRRLATWPDGAVAYSVILFTSTDKTETKETAFDAAAADIPAGYARSDDFTTLEPGRWIVFAGRFESLRKAEEAARRYRRKGFDGEARLLEGKAQSSSDEPSSQDPSAQEPAGTSG